MIFLLLFPLRQTTALMNNPDVLKIFFFLTREQPQPPRRMISFLGDFPSETFSLGTSLVPTI